MKARPRILLNHELGPREFRKTLAFRHQFIESSAFDHMSAVEHKDARGIANGREPVGDHESRASLHHFVESGVNLGFGDGIQRAGRLIEDQDRRIFQQCPRDRQPLPLAAGQHAPALAGIGVESALAALDEFQCLGAGRRNPQLFIGRVRLADAQIVRDRTIEQQRFLEHHANISAQCGERQAADIHAVDPDEARLRIEGAMQKRDRG